MANTNQSKFGVFTDMGVTIAIDQFSKTQKEALVEALFQLDGIAEMKLEITLHDGTIIKPSVLNWKHNAEDMMVLNEEDEILQLNDMMEEGIKG